MKNHIIGTALAAVITVGMASAASAKSNLGYPYNDKAANLQAMQWWQNQQMYGNPLGPVGAYNNYNPYLNQVNPYLNNNPYLNSNPYNPYGYNANPYYGAAPGFFY